MKGSLSDYEKIYMIDRSQFAVVYKSKIKETNQIVALKEVLLLDLDVSDFISYLSRIIDYHYERFIKFYNYFYVDKTIYLVNEYCLGTLSQLIEHRTLSETEISAISRKILEIISFFFSQNVKYTNIRTDNIFLCQDYQLKVSHIPTSDYIYNNSSEIKK